jgi:YegS/Rv2252/BmrU family lipid kinase
LQAQGWELTVRQKLAGGEATDLAREAVREGYDVIVDCGGDGTLNEIVAGVLGSGVAVGTLPGGTANVWAHETGISRQLDVAARQLASAERRSVDVGVVTINGKHPHYFLLMAGLGLDGAIIGSLSKPLKQHIGKLAYAPAIVKAVRTFHPLPVHIEMDGLHWQGRVMQIIAGNSRRYADVTKLTPAAYIDDGLLDVCLITASGPLGASRQLGSLLMRQQPSEATAQQYRAASMTVSAPDVLPLQVDGGEVHVSSDEVTAEGIVFTFSLVAQGVCMLVPRTYDGTLFQPQRLADIAGDSGHTNDTGGHGSGVTNAILHGSIDAGVIPHNYASNSNHHENGKRQGKQKHQKKTWQLRILSVGINTITARRIKNDKAKKEVRVVLSEDTVISGNNRVDIAPENALATLHVGDVITVDGAKDGQGVFVAHRVQLPH